MSENTPEGQVQEEAPISLGDALAAQFDSMQEEAEEEIEAVEGHGTDDVSEPEDGDDGEERAAVSEESEWDEPPPERWPAEMKEAYKKLPPEARRMMVEQVYKPMQQQYTKTTMELADQRKELEPMMAALKQHEEVFKAQGANPSEVFQNTMAWAAHLTRVGPEQGLKDMRASYGLTDDEGNEKPEQYLTPTERQLKERLDRVEQERVADREAQKRAAAQQQQQQFQRYQQAVRQEVEGFVNEEVDGKLAHPHAQELQPQIRGLIEGGLVPKQDSSGKPVPLGQQLRQAYKMAVELNPKYRTARSEDGQVRKAKAASGVNVQSNPVSRSEEIAPLPLTSELERTYDKLAGKR